MPRKNSPLTKPRPTADNWTAFLSAAIANEGDEHPGPEWKTTKEIMAIKDLGKARTLRILKSGMESGTIEMVERHIAINGRKIRQVFYRIK